jgi:hypothetical protein
LQHGLKFNSTMSSDRELSYILTINIIYISPRGILGCTLDPLLAGENACCHLVARAGGWWFRCCPIGNCPKESVQTKRCDSIVLHRKPCFFFDKIRVNINSTNLNVDLKIRNNPNKDHWWMHTYLVLPPSRINLRDQNTTKFFEEKKTT